MPRDLDPRIYNAILEIIRARHPKWIHQEEIYRHLEQSIEFTEKQLALHIQKAGQIEPNWQHDARNLLHTMKRDGTLINPFKNIYGLPLTSDTPTAPPEWNSVIAKARSIPDRYSVGEDGKITELMSNHSIPRSLVEERVRHLINCGGVLELGALHRWRSIEDALIELIDEVTLLDTADSLESLIVYSPLLGSEGAPSTMASNESRRDAALMSLDAVEAANPSKRRTRPRAPDKEKKKGSIPYAFDKDKDVIPIGLAKETGHGHYYCPTCNGDVHGVWGNTRFFRHQKIKLQPSNKDCPFYQGVADPWLDTRRTYRERLIAAKEMTVSVTFGFSTSVSLLVPLPFGSESISVKGSPVGIGGASISKLKDWEPDKGDVSLKGQHGAASFEIDATVRTDDGVVNRKWKSAGIRRGDLFIASTVDDTIITRVRPSPKFSRTKTFGDLAEDEYLVYVSSKRKLDNGLTPAREPRPLPSSDGNGGLWFHYYRVADNPDWPDGWKVGKLYLKAETFKVLIALPIDTKPSNPEVVEITSSRPLVVAIRTSEGNDEVEAQWWSGDRQWITDHLEKGWSRTTATPPGPVSDNRMNRLQFQQNHTFIQRPARPMVINFVDDQGITESMKQGLLDNPAVISIDTPEGIQEIRPLSDSKPVVLESNEFTLSSEWLFVKFAPWRVNYNLAETPRSSAREGQGIGQLNDLLIEIQEGDLQWQNIVIDWTSQSDRLACIPAVELSYSVQIETEEAQIGDIIDISEANPEPERTVSISVGDLPKTIKQAADLGGLTPIEFAMKYRELLDSDLTKLRTWLGELLSCSKREVKYPLRMKLQQLLHDDKTSYGRILLNCPHSEGHRVCRRKHRVRIQSYLEHGREAAYCRGKHNLDGRWAVDKRATKIESRSAPPRNFLRNRRAELERRRGSW